jgi:hypothetical protein
LTTNPEGIKGLGILSGVMSKIWWHLLQATENLTARDERDGEDIDVRMEIDFESSYGITAVNLIDDMFNDGEDVLT